jgi:hypothetical protein
VHGVPVTCRVPDHHQDITRLRPGLGLTDKKAGEKQGACIKHITKESDCDIGKVGMETTGKQRAAGESGRWCLNPLREGGAVAFSSCPPSGTNVESCLSESAS